MTIDTSVETVAETLTIPSTVQTIASTTMSTPSEATGALILATTAVTASLSLLTMI